MQSYQEQRFQQQVQAALKQVATVLENNRNPRVAADVPHKYDDKYLLGEFLTNIALALRQEPRCCCFSATVCVNGSCSRWSSRSSRKKRKWK